MTIAETYQIRLRQLDDRCNAISGEIAAVSVVCLRAGMSRDATLTKTKYYRTALRSTERDLDTLCAEYEAFNASTVASVA
jgi:hypothetical protein